MTVIHALLAGDKAIVTRESFERLLAIARQSEEIAVMVQEDEVSTTEMMQWAETGGAFDFWNDTGEEIYSVADGEAVS
jgi:hypothetical protein